MRGDRYCKIPPRLEGLEPRPPLADDRWSRAACAADDTVYCVCECGMSVLLLLHTLHVLFRSAPDWLAANRGGSGAEQVQDCADNKSAQTHDMPLTETVTIAAQAALDQRCARGGRGSRGGRTPSLALWSGRPC